jgi:hypothetical protein
MRPGFERDLTKKPCKLTIRIKQHRTCIKELLACSLAVSVSHYISNSDKVVIELLNHPLDGMV